MGADNGVVVDDGLAALDAVPGGRGIHLLDARVRGAEAMQALLEQRAQALVGGDGVDKERVAARLGPVQDVQKGGAGGLLLVRDVRVPRDGAGARLKVGLVALVAGAAVDEVDLRVALGGARGRVDVVAAKVLGVLEGVGDGEVGKVLVAEGDDLAGGDVVGELVLALVRQAGELDAADLAADARGQVRHLAAGGEEVGVRGVGVLAVLVVLIGLEGWVEC